MDALRIIILPHAVKQLKRRGIPETVAIEVVSAPMQVIAVRPGREVRQAIVRSPGGRQHLIRMIVDVRGDDIQLVTGYKTSRVKKYWRDA